MTTEQKVNIESVKTLIKESWEYDKNSGFYRARNFEYMAPEIQAILEKTDGFKKELEDITFWVKYWENSGKYSVSAKIKSASKGGWFGRSAAKQVRETVLMINPGDADSINELVQTHKIGKNERWTVEGPVVIRKTNKETDEIVEVLVYTAKLLKVIEDQPAQQEQPKQESKEV